MLCLFTKCKKHLTYKKRRHNLLRWWVMKMLFFFLLFPFFLFFCYLLLCLRFLFRKGYLQTWNQDKNVYFRFIDRSTSVKSQKFIFCELILKGFAWLWLWASTGVESSITIYLRWSEKKSDVVFSALLI